MDGASVWVCASRRSMFIDVLAGRMVLYGRLWRTESLANRDTTHKHGKPTQTEFQLVCGKSEAGANLCEMCCIPKWQAWHTVAFHGRWPLRAGMLCLSAFPFAQITSWYLEWLVLRQGKWTPSVSVTKLFRLTKLTWASPKHLLVSLSALVLPFLVSVSSLSAWVSAVVMLMKISLCLVRIVACYP